MVNIISYRIPELGGYLPLVNKSWRFTFKQFLYIDVANRRYWLLCSGSDIYSVLFACCSQVVVLPHHFGPSIRTAPHPLSLRSSNLSRILFLYIVTFIFIEICCKDNTFLFIFGNLAEYFSVIWIVFIRYFGDIPLGYMVFAEILNDPNPNYAEFLKGKAIRTVLTPPKVLSMLQKATYVW